MSLKLSELPEEELPREKLIHQGRKALSNAELIALFLRTGMKGKNVLDIASELIQTCGSLDALARLDAPQIAKLCKGIGLAKATTLAAAFELGGRALSSQATQKPMNSPKNVYQFLQPHLQWLAQEKIFIILVDIKLGFIALKEVSSGILNESVAHCREIFREAILHSSYGIILAHNHPSGDPTPSEADYMMTEKIMMASEIVDIKLVDHIIIGKNSSRWPSAYFSFKEHKIIK